MSTDEYVPTIQSVRDGYVWLSAEDNPIARELAEEDFDRFLACVRRDAGRDAVLRLRDHLAKSRGYGLIGPEGLDYYIRREHPEESRDRAPPETSYEHSRTARAVGPWAAHDGYVSAAEGRDGIAGNCMDVDAQFIAAARTAVPQLLDQLAAAEQRIRDLTQEVRDERGAARDQMEQVRIRDARIQAVRDACDDYSLTDIWGDKERIATADIRRALDG